MLEMVPITGNTFPVKDALKAMGGRWDADAKVWKVPASKAFAARELVQPAKAAPAPAEVGDLGGILALFAKAKGKLKFPAVELAVEGGAIRVSIAGPAAKVPGSLTVVTVAKDADGRRGWLGRVTLDGQYQPSQGAGPGVLMALKRFACDPAGVAGEEGRLTGACVFCRLPLTDARSTAVGYGATCAKNWGLPWGALPVVAKEAA